MANRKRWNIGVLLLLIVFVYVLVQFYLSTGRIRGLVTPLEAGVQDKDARLQIALISQELDNPFWRSVEQGALEAAGQFHMELQYMGPFRINAEEQMKLLEKAIASKMDGIILQGIGSEQDRQLIEKANALGIPVITVDTDEPGSKRLAYVGTNNTHAGEEMGRLIAEGNKETSGAIGVLVGSKEAANQRLRLEGFQSVIATYKGLSIAEVRSSNISRLQAAQQAEQMLKEHPEIIYLVGFSSLDGIGMAEAVARTRPGGVKIYAFDNLEDTLAAIGNKEIVSSIVQKPSQMGYKAVAILNDYFHGQPIPSEQYTPISVITEKEVAAP
ncbi:substrate-binding domain-containing protein [Paenibacillus glycanilyticus]|uniref:substrate-binding domain-containing protein n=1 Tax=Paenibacillus glycanilyticus TaxID=126569 RepID=UPI002040B5EE|nr:substrate-binding domain-containing protein [Paenibacillus glycanilyticus]MCM3628917.1 substrate-binding domain-containing protein [Paenibacillus glycanilyticus]